MRQKERAGESNHPVDVTELKDPQGRTSRRSFNSWIQMYGLTEGIAAREATVVISLQVRAPYIEWIRWSRQCALPVYSHPQGRNVAHSL